MFRKRTHSYQSLIYKFDLQELTRLDVLDLREHVSRGAVQQEESAVDLLHCAEVTARSLLWGKASKMES